MDWANPGMQKLIPLINRVQDACAKLNTNASFDLPQIAVIGGQSAGKSSVLENFVGKDFLPRGNGIVTRCPLVLQLVHSQDEYAEFLHKKGNHFNDFDEVRKEIERHTDQITGKNKGISEKAITLQVHSPNVLNLTLIDLPGITKVPVGDQPPDIESQIRAMIHKYISKESCLILAVTPANSDLANSDALKLANEVDPYGNRTIGVLTKLDLMDEGTDAVEILENRAIPLKRGYIGVVNRGQKDIDGKKNIHSALEAEKKFFESHPAYCNKAKTLGTPYLQQALNQQLTDHIRNTLPTLRDTLMTQLSIIEKHVLEYLSQPDDDLNRNLALMRIVKKFIIRIEQEIDGTNSKMVSTDHLSRGVEIRQIFHETFPKEIADLIKVNEMTREIQVVIENLHGVQLGLFTPDKAFRIIVQKQIERLRQPSMKCVEMVMEQIEAVVHEEAKVLKKYPRLVVEVERIVNEHLKKQERSSKEQISFLIDCELSYMNTKHVDFVHNRNNKVKGRLTNNSGQVSNQPATVNDATSLEAQVMESGQKKQKKQKELAKLRSDENSKKEVTTILELVDWYMPIVEKTIRDLVLKCIMLIDITQVIDFLHNDLLAHLYACGDNSYFMEEPQFEKQKREKTLRKYEAINEALCIINEANLMKVPTYNQPTNHTNGYGLE